MPISLDDVVTEVVETGLAIVDQGELIVSKAGSEAILSTVRSDGSLVLEFPIEVEVRIIAPNDPDAFADHTLLRLLRALDGLT